MDLSLIVNGFDQQKGGQSKSKWSLPTVKLEEAGAQEGACQHPTPMATPAASPTAESGFKMCCQPVFEHQESECSPTPQMYSSFDPQDRNHGPLVSGQQPLGPVRIPVLSTIEVKGVVIDHKTRKFVCQVCKKEFIRKSGLVRHNLIHLGVRPNQCSVCGKRFLQKSALTVHYRIHSGEKPYACKHCGRRFGDSSSLCRHYRMHMAKGEGGKPE